MTNCKLEKLLGQALQYLKDIDDSLVHDVIELNECELSDSELELIDNFRAFYQSHDKIRQNYLRRDDSEND